jgi:phage repressor protein C with HTH and peptisase S24 domain
MKDDPAQHFKSKEEMLANARKNAPKTEVAAPPAPEQDLDAVAPRSAERAQLEVPDGNGPIVDRQRLGLQ